MKSLSLNFHLTMVLLLQRLFCAEFIYVPSTHELVEYIEESQPPFIKADTSVLKEGDVKVSVAGNDFRFVTSTDIDGLWYSVSAIENDTNSTSDPIENVSRLVNSSDEDDSSSKTPSKDDSKSCNHLIEDDSSSSNHSIESIFSSYKNLIKDALCCNENSDEDDTNSSKRSIKNVSRSSKKLVKGDISSYEVAENVDDGESVKDYSFEKSTIVYLMEILDKCKKESTAVNLSYDHEKLLNFFDNSIGLIDLFMKVLSYKKNDRTVNLKNKIKKVSLNFDSLDNALFEIDMIINGVLVHNKKSKLKNILKGLTKFKKRFDNAKKEFEKHKKRWDQIGDFNFIMNIESLNEYKKNFIDEKNLIRTEGEKDIKNQVKNLKKDLLKNLIEDIESLYKCLKTEYDLLNFDFSILNDFLKW